MEETTKQNIIGEEAQAVSVAAEITKPQAINRKRFFLIGAVLVGLLCMMVLIYQNFANKHLPKFPSAAQPAPITVDKITTDKISIEKGNVIGKILTSYNLSSSDINKLLKAALLQKINLELLKPGQILEVSHIKNSSNGQIALKEISTKLDLHHKLKITRLENSNSYKAEIIPLQLSRDLIAMKGKIRNSLVVSAMHEGIPLANLLEATNACSYEVDFQRDIRDGDSFEILMEKFTSPEDSTPQFGKTLYFGLEMKGKAYKIYKFKPQNEEENFFTSEYQSARRGLLKTPVPAARISSTFSMRKHPILGYSMMHKGVDFAAPHGTPIYASGPGTIVDVGSNSGLGNYIKIRHGGDLSTLYAHASRFAKNIKAGMRVKQGQVIAFVGMTGRATGPHLHYGLMQGGRYIDPLKFKTPPHRVLKGPDKEALKNHMVYIDSLMKKGSA